MRQLLFFVIRLLLQLVIFGISGRWYELGRRPLMEQIPRPAKKVPAPPAAQPGKPRRVRTRPPAAGAPVAPTRSWSYRDEGERFEPEPPPLEGGPARARRSVRAREPSVSVRPRTVSSALRDRGVLRDALMLDAALGTRGRRR